MTLGLKRIILIDSFIAGKRMPLMVDGHATINGQNGSGKSSLLKLLQIFYGAESRHVENKAGGKDSFVDWYLRRDTSLIIFEYERTDGKCCLVLYRHPTSGTPKPAYRFMKGEFTPERFSVTNNKGELEFLRGKELRHHWQACGVPYSKQIEIVTDYRAIIQNDVSLLRRSSASADNKRFARDYCLGDGVGTMQHIEKVCTAIQNQHGNLRRMKDMLADIMIREGVIIPEPPNHPENIGLSERVSWLTRFEKHLPSIHQTLRQHGELLVLESQVASLHMALTAAKGNLSSQADILDENLTNKYSEIKSEREGWDNAYKKLRELLVEFESEVKQAEKDLNNLYQQRDNYDAENILNKKNEYADLERLIGLKEQVSKRVDMLHENVSTQRKPFEQRENALKERHEQANQVLREQKESVNDKLGRLTQRYREIEAEQSRRKEQALEEKRNNAEPEKQQIIKQLASAEERAKHSIKTPEEEAKLESFNATLARLRNEARIKSDQADQADHEVTAAKQLHEQAVKEFSIQKKHLAALDREVERVQKLLYPEDGSWLAQLRKEDTDWVHGIGRVVNPDLFERKDLKPEFSGFKDSLFGWDLDLSIIPPTEAANSDDELRLQFEEAQEQVHLAQQQLEQLDKTAKAKEKKHKEASQHYQQLASELQLLEQKVRGNERLQASESQRIAEAVAERKNEARKEVTALTQELQAYQTRLDEEIEVIKKHFDTIWKENQSAEATEKSELEAQKEDIDSRIKNELIQHDNAIKSLWSDFEKLCSEQGIDIETITSAERELTTAKQTVIRVQGYHTVIMEYDTWLENRWSQREKFQKRLEDNQQGEREIISKINRERSQHEKQLTALEKQQTAIEAELKKTRNLLNEVIYKLDQIGPIPANLKIEPVEGTPAYLISEAAEKLEVLKKLKHKVAQQIKQAEAAINSGSDEQIADIWQRMIQELEISLGKELTDDPHYWRHLPPLLERFVHEFVPTIQETLIQTIVGVGQQLADYFHGLKSADRSIHSYSSKISESIVKSLDVEALSEVNIRLESNIKSLEYWHRLEQFISEWTDWQETSYGELPSTDLIEAMGKALIILSKVKSARDLRALFSLSLELRENGRLAIIKNDEDLANASSRGLSYLALCGIFIGITHYLCHNRTTYIHWPVDELEVIDGSNINRLFGMLDRAKITMVAGFPSKDANLLRLFKHHHVIKYGEGIKMMNPEKSNLLSQIEKQKARNNIMTSGESDNA
jgi:hypothetical protein